jgi:hypothetical protein
VESTRSRRKEDDVHTSTHGTESIFVYWLAAGAGGVELVCDKCSLAVSEACTDNFFPPFVFWYLQYK